LVCERDRRHGLEQGPNQNLQVKTGSVEIFPVVVVFLANPARRVKELNEEKEKRTVLSPRLSNGAGM
jgi:hypothetical protein